MPYLKFAVRPGGALIRRRVPRQRARRDEERQQDTRNSEAGAAHDYRATSISQAVPTTKYMRTLTAVVMAPRR
jgi:hypothetical protein